MSVCHLDCAPDASYTAPDFYPLIIRMCCCVNDEYISGEKTDRKCPWVTFRQQLCELCSTESEGIHVWFQPVHVFLMIINKQARGHVWFVMQILAKGMVKTQWGGICWQENKLTRANKKSGEHLSSSRQGDSSAAAAGLHVWAGELLDLEWRWW